MIDGALLREFNKKTLEDHRFDSIGMNDQTKVKEITSHKLIGECIENELNLATTLNTYSIFSLLGLSFAIGNFTER
jgi:hypothetical protein